MLDLLGRTAGAFSTDHAQAIYGKSRQMTLRRLRKLVHHRYLGLHLPDGRVDRPNWYTLDTAGRALVARLFDREPAKVRCRRGLPRQLEHHRMCVDVLVNVFIASSRSRSINFRQASLAGDQRDRRRGAVVPDVALELDARTDPVTLLVEVDRGTERGAVLAAKVKAYDGMAMAGALPPGASVLFILPSGRRMVMLGKALAEMWPVAPVFHLAVVGTLDASNILTDSWFHPEVSGGGLRLVRGRLCEVADV